MRLSTLLVTSSLMFGVAGQELAKLLEDTEVVKGYDWEWVLIRINRARGAFVNADYLGSSDTQVVVTALGAATPDVEFDSNPSVYESFVDSDDNSPEWFQIGMVSYKKGSVSKLEFVLKDQDEKNNEDDLLMNTTIDLPTQFNGWEYVFPQKGDYFMNVSVWRATVPVFTEEDHQRMNLQEEVLELADGSKAVLSYKLAPTNEKAVLYFAGKDAAFAHPHVLKMYEEKGYDFFVLDVRYTGRARRFLDESNFRLATNIGSFDTYKEEIDRTMEFIRSQNKTYTKPLAHTHSSGSLVALNYALLVGGEPFEGYVLNGPFLEWGPQEDLHDSFADGTEAISWFGFNNAEDTDSLDKYVVEKWIINRFNTSDRPMISGNTTLEWAQAATIVQNKIEDRPRKDPITSTPVLLIASKGDYIFTASQLEDRMPHIHSNYSKVILTYHSNDVTYSGNKAMDNEAIAIISAWLDNPEAFRSSVGRIWTGVALAVSSVMGLLQFL